MLFQCNDKLIHWKLHFQSSPKKVYQFISTDTGRNKFWAKTNEREGEIEFTFPNSFVWKGKILLNQGPNLYSIRYIDNSTATFYLESDNKGGTDLTLEDRGVKPEYRTEVIAGWGWVLMCLKAAVDFDVDLRNNDPKRTWDQGYFNNWVDYTDDF